MDGDATGQIEKSIKEQIKFKMFPNGIHMYNRCRCIDLNVWNHFLTGMLIKTFYRFILIHYLLSVAGAGHCKYSIYLAPRGNSECTCVHKKRYRDT